MHTPPDYRRYHTLHISRRGEGGAVLDICMKAANGKLPTAGHDGHWELAEIWRDVGRDDSVRCAVLRGEGQGFSGGGGRVETGLEGMGNLAGGAKGNCQSGQGQNQQGATGARVTDEGRDDDPASKGQQNR